jgi:tRNA pseudouridine55 synthase
MGEKEFNFAEGEVLLFDKPLEWTSFDVVNKVRNIIRRQAGKKIKVGHAGTLDPLATGLLILCSGKFTKKIENYQGMEKEYVGELVLGSTTASCDLETEVVFQSDIKHLNPEDIHAQTANFQGFIDQMPPMFSALKVNGKVAYKEARKGKTIELKSRQVEIKVFEITKIDLPKVNFRVVCSKGTYIRSLVRDFGEALEVGAYMSALQRTKIGDFDLKDAFQLKQFEELCVIEE